MKIKDIIPLLGFGVAFVSMSISAIWLIVLQVINIDKTTMRIAADNPAICIVVIGSVFFLMFFYKIIKKKNK